MPSSEFLNGKQAHPNVGLAVQDLKVFILYSCPVCRRYTIHSPRVDEAGMCFMDHKRVSLHQQSMFGSAEYVGFQAVDYCFVPGVHPAANIETTRTVIRVK